MSVGSLEMPWEGAQLAYAEPRESPATDQQGRLIRRERLDEGAVAELYQRHAPAIFVHCRRFLGSPASARDATHEVFVRVLVRNSLPAGDGALPYLYRVATNFCLNQLRERRVRDRAAGDLHRAASDPGASHDGHADRQFASAVLARTDEMGAAIAVLHHLDGLSQVEIARTLGITRRTVFNRLRRLKDLAEELMKPSPPSEKAG